MHVQHQVSAQGMQTTARASVRYMLGAVHKLRHHILEGSGPYT